MITIDFETYPIVKGSPAPPTPVGVSIKVDDEPSTYYAWGHIENDKLSKLNTCSFEIAAKQLWHVALDNNELLFHNAKFDLAVLNHYFGISPESCNINDSMILAYLNDAREPSLALKELIVKHCGVPPDERDELRDWILRNVSKAKSDTWGEFIYLAPVPLVAKYACADTDMTYNLFNTLKSKVGI
jgi:DNA polymerase I-like protein with 3'-5' exonuclease and polymerase domains